MKKFQAEKPGVIIIEGHVQGLANTRALGMEGIPVIVVDTRNCIASYSRFCKRFFICPPYIDENFIVFLEDLCLKEGLNDWLLLPSNDHAVYNISKNKDLLSKYYKIITPSIDVIEQIYNKEILLKISKSIGLPIPTSYFNPSDLLKESDRNIRFPLITRGKFGLSFYKKTHKKAYVSKDLFKFKAHLAEIEKCQALDIAFTQEFIPFDGSNRTISFTAFCIDGKIRTYWMGKKLRDHPHQFGTATFSKSIYEGTLLEYSKSLLQELNYTGVCEVEFLKDPRDNEYKVIEVNARTWLWVGLANACGVNYAKMIYDFVNQHDIHYPETYDKEKYWINPVSDTAFAILGMLQGKINPVNYLYSFVKGKKVNALFLRGDLKPGFAYLFNIFSFLTIR
jgi:D-aspartate ligase